MSHNATGYDEDMNPDMIDGIHRPAQPVVGQQRQAGPAGRGDRRTASIPSRIVYHHSSGNLGSMHTSNFYTNMAPVQELDDWFEHWATKGVKPMFTCEYMVPCTWDWTMYRGWYKGVRDVRQRGGALGVLRRRVELAVPRRPGLPDQRGGEEEPPLGGRAVPRRQALASLGLPVPGRLAGVRRTSTRSSACTWPTTGGRSAPGACRPTRLGNTTSSGSCATASTRAASSSRSIGRTCSGPGFSPDYLGRPVRPHGHGLRAVRLDCRRPTGRPSCATTCRCLAYIGGKPAAFTSKDHNFSPGETVEKQLIIINNSRETVTCRLPLVASACRKPFGRAGGPIRVDTGQQERIPLRLTLPPDLAPGKYKLSATVKLQQRRDAEGRLRHPRHAAPGRRRSGREDRRLRSQGRDGQAADQMGVQSQPVEAGADLAGYDMLVVGKAALDAGWAGPGRRPRPRRVESRRVRADRGSAGEAVRVPRRRVRAAAGLPARAGPSAAGRARRWRTSATGGAKRRFCRRG